MQYSQVLSFARELRKNQTKAENFFWQKVRNRKFLNLKFNRQYIIKYKLLSDTDRYFIVDFYCSEYKLIVELDGPIHNYQLTQDAERQQILESYGYNIIRFTNDEILNHWTEVSKKLEHSIMNSLK